MKLALEALIDDAANDDDNANDTDANDTNDDYTNNNNDDVGVIVIVGIVVVVGVVIVGVNVLCFGSTGLYWSYLEGGPYKTEAYSGKFLFYATVQTGSNMFWAGSISNRFKLV